MKVISVNLGKPKLVSYKGKDVYTAIFKSPVQGARKVSAFNIDGDAQGDLNVHGGELKAVYSYDISYYEHWRKILDRDDWSYGSFGENLTTENLPDEQVLIGNVYQVGSVLLKAVQPRFPCFKLNIKFGIDDMLQQFMQQEKNGIYFSIVREGSLQAGDAIILVEASKHKITIQQLAQAYNNKGTDKNAVEQILAIEFLPPRLRKAFESFMSNQNGV